MSRFHSFWTCMFSNCLAYRYWYWPKFYNWLLVFLGKCRLPVQTNTLLYVAGIFPVIFLFPCDIVAICLCPTYRVMMVQYLSVFRFVGPYSCCCVLNPKSTKGATHFLVWWGITVSPTCVHISVRIFGWMVRSLD